jgi:hypothetical protein
MSKTQGVRICAVVVAGPGEFRGQREIVGVGVEHDVWNVISDDLEHLPVQGEPLRLILDAVSLGEQAVHFG